MGVYGGSLGVILSLGYMQGNSGITLFETVGMRALDEWLRIAAQSLVATAKMWQLETITKDGPRIVKYRDCAALEAVPLVMFAISSVTPPGYLQR